MKTDDDRHGRGRAGEALAAAYLRQRGYRTLAQRYRCRAGELDLVMEDADGTLVFVEVRTRAAGALCSGLDSVDRRKRDALLRAASTWLATSKRAAATSRFDVIAIAWDPGGRHRVQHVADAFRPEGAGRW